MSGTARIGYVPYSADLSTAADRRRFCRYAELRNIPYEVYRPDRRYDVVVVAMSGDLTHWSRRQRDGTAVVFDMVDSYLSIPSLTPRAALRGLAKYALGQHQHLELSYRHTLERMCAQADTVICSTPEQCRQVAPWNSSSHSITDFHSSEYRTPKRNYERNGRELHLFWEGFGANVFTLGMLREPVSRLSEQFDVTFHVVSELQFRPYNGPAPTVSTHTVLKKALPAVRSYVYEWNPLSVSAIGAACDIGVIPIPRRPAVYWDKPENKLLIMWRLGIPTLTSPTPAYRRTMKRANIDMTCESAHQWTALLSEYARDEEARANAGTHGRRYVEQQVSDEQLCNRWDRVFAELRRPSRQLG